MKSSLISILILSSLNVSAGVQRNVISNETISNTNCKSTDSCTLKNMNLKVTDYIVSSAGKKSYGTSAYISYETESVKHIEDYAIVQFIKGCAYNSKLDENGEVVKIKNVSRKFFGSYHKFIHPEWVIDSIDKDPIYNSSTDNDSRHEYYRWNEDPNSYSDENEHYVLHRYPTHPKVYVSDFPSTSTFSYDSAKNTVLEFKTCVYKTSDIPREVGPEDINFGTALQCLDWKTSSVYNFKTRKYEHDKTVGEACSDLK